MPARGPRTRKAWRAIFEVDFKWAEGPEGRAMDRAASRLVSLFLGMLLLATQGSAGAASGDEPPRFEVAAPVTGAPLTFVVYGDTRFSRREQVVNAPARRALVRRIAATISRTPVAIAQTAI